MTPTTDTTIAPTHALPYLTGGSAIFTLVNGTLRIPYRIAAPKVQDKGREVYFVRATLAAGAEPEYIGYFVSTPEGTLVWRTSAKSATGPAATRAADAISYVVGRLCRHEPIAPYTIEGDGKCSRCRASLPPDRLPMGRHAHACTPPLRRTPPKGGWPTPSPAPSPAPGAGDEGQPAPSPGDGAEGDEGEPQPQPAPQPTPQPEGDSKDQPPSPGDGDGEPAPAPPQEAPEAAPNLTPAQASLARALRTLTLAVGGTMDEAQAARIAAAHLGS